MENIDDEPVKRGRGRPATGRRGEKSSVYAGHDELALWTTCAQQLGKTKTEVFEEAIREYSQRHGVA